MLAHPPPPVLVMTSGRSSPFHNPSPSMLLPPANAAGAWRRVPNSCPLRSRTQTRTRRQVRTRSLVGRNPDPPMLPNQLMFLARCEGTRTSLPCTRSPLLGAEAHTAAGGGSPHSSVSLPLRWGRKPTQLGPLAATLGAEASARLPPMLPQRSNAAGSLHGASIIASSASI